jgi:ribonuclease HI
VDSAPGDPAGSPEGIIAEKSGSEPNTTNNRMELLAVISALEEVRKTGAAAAGIGVYTDSQYVQKGMSAWIKDWKARGWKTAGKTPVKNTDLWQRLDALASGMSVTWHWVKGHAGNVYNERCDSLVRKAIASLHG